MMPIHMLNFITGYPLCWVTRRSYALMQTNDKKKVTCKECLELMEKVII